MSGAERALTRRLAQAPSSSDVASRKLRKGRGLHSHRYFECGRHRRKPLGGHTVLSVMPGPRATRTHVLQAPQLLPVCLSLSVSLTLFICFLLFDVSSACLSVSVCLFSLIRCLAGGRVPARGGGGRGGLAWSALDAGPRSHHSRLSSRPGLGDGVAYSRHSLTSRCRALPGWRASPKGTSCRHQASQAPRPQNAHLALAWAEAKTRGPHAQQVGHHPQPPGTSP